MVLTILGSGSPSVACNATASLSSAVSGVQKIDATNGWNAPAWALASSQTCGIGGQLEIHKIFFLYCLFFILFLIAGTRFIKPYGDGLVALWSLILPLLLVWWYERLRTSAKIGLARQKDERRASQSNRDQQSAQRRPEVGSSPRPSAAPTATAPTPRKWQELDFGEVVRKNRENPVEMPTEAPEPRIPEATATPSPFLLATYHSALSKPTAPLAAVAVPKQGWVPKGQLVTVHGRQLQGMVYVGVAPVQSRHGYGEKVRPYIDPSLPVARFAAAKDGAGMPYWPSYSGIPPECRATYLDWLASGPTDASVNPGYMFLYFYGLERRFFVDSPDTEEQLAIIEEVRRLLALFQENQSSRTYLGTFLQLAEVAARGAEALQPIFDSPTWDVPFSVKVAVGARLQRGETLEADWVLSWYLCHPEKNLRTSARRCGEEFRALFRLRFAERYPAGLKVSKPRALLKGSYQAASREFEGSVSPSLDGKPLPDISGTRKPIEVAQEIADSVMDDLEKFSRFLGRNPEGRGSIEAHALLPPELRHLFPSKELEEVRSWAVGVVDAGGLVPVVDVLERLEGERPAQLGKRQLTGAADALARMGIGLAPDPRHALRSPALNEPVVLFDIGMPVELLEDVSSAYKAAVMELALGTFVAHADGIFSDVERSSLKAKISTIVGLSDLEQRSLSANLQWFAAVPPDLTLLRRRLKETYADQQPAIRAALVAAAHADGIVSSEEVAGIEKIYRALGLDPNLVYSDLHAGEISDGPVRVRPAQSTVPGETIPAEQKAKPQMLDAALIASIKKDTERVSTVLSDIFASDSAHEEAGKVAVPTDLAGLDAKHTALVRELISRLHWDEAEFGALSARHGLMASGALETVNEWAYGVYDDALLEEYDGYDVSADIAEALADAFEREK